MRKLTIIATSLNPDSKSQLLARQLAEFAQGQGIEHSLLDLRDLPLPNAGAPDSRGSENAAKIQAEVESASHVVFASPVYCYDLNAVAKNLIELIGRSFTKKVVGFVCSAGGQGSYMAPMGFANHLMLDFRSIIAPRFFYAAPEAWADETTLTPELQQRLQGLLHDLAEIQIAE